MTTSDPRQFVPVAEVTRPVGLRGEVKLYPLIDWHADLLASRHLEWEGGEPVRVERARAAGGGIVVAVAGCGDRDAAAALVGRRLGFRRGSYLEPDFPRPPGGLPFRWLDREVVTGNGEPVGRVVEVRRYGPQPTLVVAAAAGEVLIPAVPPILRPDPGLEGPLVVDPPEGLLDDAAD